MKDRLLIFTGNSNPQLARSVCACCDVALGRMAVKRFSDGEVQVEIQETVRGRDVFVIQSTCPPVNDHLIELLVVVNALKKASAGRITGVIPYYGYGRQDEKQQPRVPITAKLVSDLLAVAGISKLVSVDLHADQIEGFIDMPVDHIRGTDILLDAVRDELRGDEIVIAPDVAGVERAREFAGQLNAELAILDYRGAKDLSYSRIVGNVQGRRVIILDDMVDTGRTLVRTAEGARSAGATIVDAICVHGLFSGQAVDLLEASPLRSVTVTDTIPLSERARRSSKIRSISIAPILAQVIQNIHEEVSVGALLVRA